MKKDGCKELTAVEDGCRESKKSWLSVLRDLAARGIETPPACHRRWRTGLLGRDSRALAQEQKTALLGSSHGERGRQVAKAISAEGKGPNPRYLQRGDQNDRGRAARLVRQRIRSPDLLKPMLEGTRFLDGKSREILGRDRSALLDQARYTTFDNISLGTDPSD